MIVAPVVVCSAQRERVLDVEVPTGVLRSTDDLVHVEVFAWRVPASHARVEQPSLAAVPGAPKRDLANLIAGLLLVTALLAHRRQRRSAQL